MSAAAEIDGKACETRPGFMRAVAAALTWRALLTALGLGLALNLLRLAQYWRVAPPNMPWSGLVITNLGALSVLIAALTADEAIRRGARLYPTFFACLMSAAVVATAGQWYIRRWLHLYTVMTRPGIPLLLQLTQNIMVAFDVIIYGGFAMLAYLNNRSAQRILDGVRGAELRRVRLERQLTESRLATARAQLDPDRLLFDLAQVRDLYARGGTEADSALDALITNLRISVSEAAAALRLREPPP
ncbi:MAG TPA: hypothetical protein VHV81_03065 [Steroidobacteraceae bacterium]|nr:hypothetical protein [Steroidobacteraceae bacterium]